MTYNHVYSLRLLRQHRLDPSEFGGTVEGSNVVFRLDYAKAAELAQRLSKPLPPKPSAPAPFVAPEPLPRSEWPLVVRIVARFANESDKGVGDTVRRAAALIGGELVKAVFKAAGKDCGCATRQKWLSARFPYEKT